MRPTILSLCLMVALLVGLVSSGWANSLQDLLEAAEKGSPRAQFKLGLMYQEGDGVSQSYEMAAKWHKQAAKQGLPEAQDRLGFLYTFGIGVPWDRAEALRWYRRAVAQGYARAQFNLGVMHIGASACR